MINFLNLKSEHSALEAINKLEAAVFTWKERISEQASGKSPVRTSWSFIKDPISELDKIEFLLERAEALIQQLKNRYPNLPQTFLDATKIQYGKVSFIHHFKFLNNLVHRKAKHLMLLRHKFTKQFLLLLHRMLGIQYWKHTPGFLQTWLSAYCLG